MTPLDVLRGARERISSEDHWLQGTYARVSGEGAETAARSPSATCWCSIGAIMAAAGDGFDPKAQLPDASLTAGDEALNTLRLVLADMGQPIAVAGYNDSHSHAEVMALFDAAIERLEDRTSSASRQHFIDTGRYLAKGEAGQ